MNASYYYTKIAMPHKLGALLLSLMSIANACAQKTQTDVDKFMTTLWKNQQFNGNVLIAENGKIIYEKSFGYADFSKKILNTKGSGFPVASITKSFTATAILQLCEGGQLKLDDPVAKYLPEFPYPAITIRNLLSHTSGLQPYDNFLDSLRHMNPDTVFSNKDVLQQYASLKLPLFYQPGEDCNYDNVNYIFLALVVEKISQKSYHDYVTEYIFKPAGMSHSFFPGVIFYHYSQSEKVNLSNLYWYPHLYSTSLEKVDTVAFVSQYWKSYNFQGFGEIVSTAEDLRKYDEAFYNGKLLKLSTLKEAYSPVLLNNGKPNKGNNNGNSFGLGWIIETDSSYGKIVRGSGGAIGLRATLLRNITKHQTIILLDNTQNETDDIARGVLKILNGKSVKPYGKSAAKLFGNVLSAKGIHEAVNAIRNIKKDTKTYYISEGEFNNLGYDLMTNGKQNEALVTFKLNTELFPLSWNVYDSYGEALLKNGQKDEAIKMYKKSVTLNPGNENGKRVLEQIMKQ